MQIGLEKNEQLPSSKTLLIWYLALYVPNKNIHLLLNKLDVSINKKDNPNTFKLREYR